MLDLYIMPKQVAEVAAGYRNMKTLAGPDTYSDTISIWMVEDMTNDAAMARYSFDACKIPYRLNTMRRGYEFMQALNSKQLTKPDIIFLDLGLPDMDGFEVLENLVSQKAEIRAIPIVVLTAQKNFEYLKQTYPISIFAYLNKPCDKNEMQQILSRIQQQKMVVN